MSVPAAIRFIDVATANVGSTGVSGIKAIKYSSKTKRIAGGGDGDKVETFEFRGMTRTSGSVLIEDIVQANALLALAHGDMVLTGKPSTGSTTLTITIKGCSFFDLDADAKWDELHGASVSFNGFSPTTSAAGQVTTTNA